MASIVDLDQLAKRLRTLADALKRASGDHILLPEEMEALGKEVRAIAGQLRRCGVGRAGSHN